MGSTSEGYFKDRRQWFDRIKQVGVPSPTCDVFVCYDDNGDLRNGNSLVEKIKQQIANGKLKDATETWSDLEDVIDSNTNSVDFYNFLLDSGMDPVSMTATELVRTTPRKRYLRYLDSLKTSPGENGDLDLLMNGVIRKKLGIIPNDVEWGGQSGLVFQHLEGDFMRPRINEARF
ncbi:putative carboxypeptidase C [Helianthus debilis subsp. tardiflorus]